MKVGFTFNSGSSGQISFRKDLIMLHSEDHSCEWNPDHVGISIFCNIETFQLRFHSQDLNYQSFFIKIANFEKVRDFFYALRFKNCVVVSPEQAKVMEGIHWLGGE